MTRRPATTKAGTGRLFEHLERTTDASPAPSGVLSRGYGGLELCDAVRYQMKPPYCFKIIRHDDAADFDSVRISLFSTEYKVCGWYISPVTAAPISEGYVPKSANLLASSAVFRAVAIAEKLKVEVCVIDPDNLWSEIWRS